MNAKIRTGQLASGTHCGFDYIVTHNGMGFRCGYVRISEGHPWHGKHYDQFQCHCHGGLTYANADTQKPSNWWIGFDCAHVGDQQDLDLPANVMLRFVEGAEIRTTEYVESECKGICEQAAACAELQMREART